MAHRERVMATLSHEEPDCIPIDGRWSIDSGLRNTLTGTTFWQSGPLTLDLAPSSEEYTGRRWRD